MRGRPTLKGSVAAQRGKPAVSLIESQLKSPRMYEGRYGIAPRTMEKTPPSTTPQIKSAGSGKKRDQFLAVLRRHLKTCHIDTSEKVLVIGGSWQDAEVLHCAGFQDITLSNVRPELEEDKPPGLCLKVRRLTLDAERIELEDGSFDCVVAHEVLHHCRSPHKALCEMLRVAGKHILLLEPNDSFMMRVLSWSGVSFPYEIFSVAYHGYEAGGVRDSCVPNFIYRWNANEVRKTVSSYLAEYMFHVHPHPHWDFNENAVQLSMRKETTIPAIISVIGAKTFLALLRVAQNTFNAIPILRKQGNKFFCCVEKTSELRPWLTSNDGKVAFDSRLRNVNQ
jgi:SAM-dependent methyltransferase